MANATPTTPKDQFSSRREEGSGVAHRKNPGGGRIALFGNTPLEVQNFRKFVTHKMDFLYNWETDTTNIWTISNYNGATCTFTIDVDEPDGLAVLDVADATDNHGGQIQFVNAASAGEFFDPSAANLICAEFFVNPITGLNTDWFVGLAVRDTAVLAFATGLMDITYHIGFHHLEADNQIRLSIANGTDLYTAITPATALSAAELGDAYYRLGIRIENNNRFHWYIDDAWVGTMTVGDAVTGGTVVAFTVGTEMCYTAAMVNGTDAVQGLFYFDYIATNMTRNADRE